MPRPSRDRKDVHMFGVEVKMPKFMSPYDNTFRKSTYTDLKKFVTKTNACKKWLIVSDYVFNGKNAKKDVAAFVLIPYLKGVDEIIAEINRTQTQDIKNTKTVSNRLIRYFSRGQFFPIVNTFEKNMSLDPGHNDMAALMQICESWQRACSILASNFKGLSGASQYADTQGLLLDVVKMLPRCSSSKVALLRELVIAVNIASYLTKVLRDDFCATDVSWFSDRDPMQASFCGNDYYRFAPNLYVLHLQTQKKACEEVAPKAFRPSYVVAKPSGDLWYDALIRVADYFCGTFSRIDSEDDKMDRALNKLLCKYVIGNPCSVLNVTEKSVTRSVFSVK